MHEFKRHFIHPVHVNGGPCVLVSGSDARKSKLSQTQAVLVFRELTV